MRLLYAVLLILTVQLANAEDWHPWPPEQSFPIPERYTLVNDYHGVLPFAKGQEIVEKLRALERRNGTQIVLLIVPSTGNEGVAAYSLRAAEKWDIGNNGQGNGVLFLIDARGYFYIRTGPGISGALPDVMIRRIWEKNIKPHWQRHEFVEGIDEAIDTMIAVANGEDTKPAIYDYFAYQPTPEHLGIAALSITGIAYALGLIWYRRRKRLKQEDKT